MNYEHLMQADPELYASMERELGRQRDHLELIASENFTSPAVMEAVGSHLTNKYAEGYPGARYYGGCDYVDEVERLAIDRVTRLFGADHANVQPHSGSQANMAVYAALLQPGDRILGMNLSHGGHLTHGSKASLSGKYFEAHFYGVDPETETIDYDALARVAEEVRPKIIIAGASAYPRVIDFARFRQVADSVGAYLMVDMAHIGGLVAAGVHPSPVPYADVVTCTTHKTLRGPRGAIILCLTSIDTANALADCLKSKYSQISTELVDINDMRDEKMKLNFTKMHGTGNDYIYFSTFDQRIDNPEALSVRLSDRHFGIGGDGIILVCPSDKADAKMRIFNLDGSEGKMCGNGIRCVGKFIYDHGMVDIKKKDRLDIETLSGIKHLKAYTLDGEVKSLRVDMGKAILDPKEIPAKMDKDKIVNEPYTIDGEEYNITCVSMGNPHCVVFIKGDIDNLELDKIGPKFENDKLFPERVNTEFVKVLDDHTIKMRVWERGSGETWACGTGACAAAVAACENGFCNKGDDITVKLKGGDLVINYTDETVYMTGEAERVFEGTVEV